MKQPFVRVLAVLTVTALLGACSSEHPDASALPTATATIGVTEGSLSEGRMLDWSLTLLHLCDSGVNTAISAAALTSEITALRQGTQGQVRDDVATALGAQTMSDKQIADAAYKARQTLEKLKLGRYGALWCMFVGEQQPVRETYLSESLKTLQMSSRFVSFAADKGAATLNEWADTGTDGMISDLDFQVPSEDQPFFVDVALADPDWQTALDPAKTRPMPYTYEDGNKSAVPTLVFNGRCGVYQGPEGSLAVLPLAGDEARLVVLFPKEISKLTDFYTLALQKHDDWLAKATWSAQRVLLPRFTIGYRGSVKGALGSAGMGALFDPNTDYNAMGQGLHPADVLADCRLIVDESGVSTPDPKATYRAGVDDGVPTLAVNRSFLVLLEKTDTGAILMAGAVRDPLKTSEK